MALISQQEASDNKKAQSFFKKVPNPPVHLSECLYIKGFRCFHPSLDPSRHPSLDPSLHLPRKERLFVFAPYLYDRANYALIFEF